MNIHTLSDREVESRLKYLASKERELLHLVLEHIKEVEIRRLFLQRGYPTMYDYLTKELQYSGAAAMRRLEASRILRDIPAVAAKIHQGSINLSQLSELSRALKEKNKSGEDVSIRQKTELIEKMSGLSTLETQREIAQNLSIKLKRPEQVRMQRDESVHLSVTFSPQQHALVVQAKDKAAHLMQDNRQDHSWSSFFEVLARSYLFNKMKLFKEQQNLANEAMSVKGKEGLTLRLRRQVLNRDRHCQYVDPVTGKQCESTYGLEVDHKISRWAGGGNNLENLQALCSAHNKFKYQQEAGIHQRPNDDEIH